MCQGSSQLFWGCGCLCALHSGFGKGWLTSDNWHGLCPAPCLQSAREKSQASCWTLSPRAGKPQEPRATLLWNREIQSNREKQVLKIICLKYEALQARKCCWLVAVFFFLNEREYSQSKQNQKSFALLFCLCLHSPPHSEQHLPPSSLPAAAQPCTVPCSQERSLHSPPWSSTSSLPPSHSLPSLYTPLFLLQGSLGLRLNQACIFLAPQGKLIWNV